MARLISIIHGLFIMFVFFGGFALFFYPSLLGLHLACAAWGVFVELANFPCPLTQLEEKFRDPKAPLQVDFITHYCIGHLFPGGFTPFHHKIIGVILIFWQAVVYFLVFG